jgi:TolB-like protein
VPADRYESAAAFARALHDVDAREGPASQPALMPEPVRTTRSGSIGPAIALVSIAVVIALAVIAWRGGLPGGVREDTPSASSSPRSLAVLPFENRSPDRNDEYFSDGLTEELLHRLARLPRFRVAARTSSFAFKGKPVDVSEVAQQLEVEAIVSGSVRRDGDLLRVTVQVIDVTDGRPIWSEVFERQSREAFRVQDEIAEAIVQRLDPEGAAPVRQAGPSPESFDLYLRGRHQWNRRTAEGAAAAIQLLTKAIALAPDYARAHAALAEAYAVMGFYDYLPPRTAFTKAREAANRAASLDPALPEVPNTLAYVALYHDWNLDLARREFTRAIDLSPRFAVAHQWYANALTVAGQFTEAAAAMRRAVVAQLLRARVLARLNRHARPGPHRASGARWRVRAPRSRIRRTGALDRLPARGPCTRSDPL